jgi:hypothetical protein
MARTNGKTQFEEQQMDVEHELPPSDGSEDQPSPKAERLRARE